MSLRFRNLDFDSSAALDEWPAEAIETLIDRGSLSDWRALARAIEENPWGPAARTTENVVGWGEHYGIDPLLERVVRHAREEATLRGRVEYAAEIRRWRRRAGMTLRQLALAAGTSASRLSDYENAKVAPTTDVLGRLRAVAGRGVEGRLELDRSDATGDAQ
ncbi:MAG TPA: helix-turn-helix transcriptional regulator [Solirubrobacteraceae bacterium]|nr:helix-turn-helix transcriptional regulator [Solirubrobacteraceae bacterium]